MKYPTYRMLRSIFYLALVTTLAGCGGYANTADGGSGVQMYGTVDTGLVHQSR